MTTYEKKLRPGELKKGMYVSRLDRPWEETPFLFQGIRIQGQEDIETLQAYCEHVYIDPEKAEYAIDESDTAHWTPDPGDETISDLKLTQYSSQTSLEEELPRARQHREQLIESVHDFMQSVRDGKKIDIQNIETGLRRVEESILNNPSAFMLLRLLKEKDNYTYEHCVDVSALSIIIGRKLGLPRDILDRLALGAVLFDVGKMNISSDILNKNAKLTDEEYTIIQTHVNEGIKIVSDIEDVHKSVLDIVATHHERYDGSGYPNRLKGKNIPILGRIVGVADCYDAMTSRRSYSKALPSDQVIREIYKWRDTLFQDEIIEYFIQAIGIYPVGSIVEMSNGEIALVVAQNDLRRLRPKIMTLLDENKRHVFTNKIRDLYYDTTHDGKPLDIIRAVDPDTYELDPKVFIF